MLYSQACQDFSCIYCLGKGRKRTEQKLTGVEKEPTRNNDTCEIDNSAVISANATATESIQQANAGTFIPKISENNVQQLLDTDTIFIDARFARDFEAGHIEGAISIPVNASDQERQKATADIAKDGY